MHTQTISVLKFFNPLCTYTHKTQRNKHKVISNMITKEQMTLPHEALHWWHHLKQVEVRLQLEIKQTNKGINMTKHLEILNVLKEIVTMLWTCLTEHQLLLLNALLFRNNGCQHLWPTIPTTEAILDWRKWVNHEQRLLSCARFLSGWHKLL